MDKYIGKELNGRYVINEIIGIGGMAVVYKAYDKLVDRVVAVKILKEEFVENSMFRKRFSNESRVISMMSHVNIVDIYDVNLEGDLQYIVMEYVDGINLKEFINKKGALTANESLFFTSQILSALTHAHERGIVHRDIKPHNIMLIRDGTVKVGDFGIARAAKFDTVTMTDKAIGSVHYISPEQASGIRTDEKSDIYSVGVLLYEMVTGKLPFEGDTPVTVALMQVQAKPKLPSEILPEIPRGLEEIIMKAMAKNPENRYQTALEMSDDIEKFKENPDVIFGYNLFIEESPTMIIDSVSALTVPKKKKAGFLPIILGIVTALVCCAIGIGIVFWVGSSDETKATVEVPELVGENFNDIINNKKYPNIRIIDSGKGTYSEKYEAGIITTQDIPKGEKIAKSGTITVEVSKGIASTSIPDIVGLTESQATDVLRLAGFIVVPKYEVSDSVASGCVIKTNPEKGTPSAAGAQVEVYISSGSLVKKISVPNVMGKYEREAMDAIRDAGLEYAISYQDDWSNEVGKVVKQSPSKGALVDPNTVITITVTQRAAT